MRLSVWHRLRGAEAEAAVTQCCRHCCGNDGLESRCHWLQLAQFATRVVGRLKIFIRANFHTVGFAAATIEFTADDADASLQVLLSKRRQQHLQQHCCFYIVVQAAQVHASADDSTNDCCSIGPSVDAADCVLIFCYLTCM